MKSSDLRPRYGQTNCFVGTAINYGVFAANDKEAYVCTQRAARNMTFQGIFDVRGQVNQLTELEGSVIVGAKIKAPFSVYPEVYVLPMDNVLPTKVRLLALDSENSQLTAFVGYGCCHLRPI
jgi:leucyl-tRNA synthetase